MFSRATLFAGALVGGMGVFFIMMAANALWIIPKAKEAGAEMERAAALRKSIEIIQKRGKTNEEVNALTDQSICRELGGEWVPDENLCR